MPGLFDRRAGDSVSDYWSAIVRDLEPYVPGEQPAADRLTKLNTNENPYDPSPAVLRAITEATARLRFYPDPESTALRGALARLHGLAPDQVFVGNGSDEVLAHAFFALLRQERPICFPDITYSFYPVWCQLYGIDFQTVPLRDDFSVDVAAYPRDCGGIVLANPNAPTGVLLSLEQIEVLLQSHPDVVVVVDEAYIDFGGVSAVALVSRYPNLLVVQTLSKSRSLAGLRVGMAFGQAHLVEGLNRVKNSFNSYPLDNLAQAAALAALEDEGWFEETVERVVSNRESLREGLVELGFEVLPSAANFLFARHPYTPARDLFSGLRGQGIVVRYFDKPRIDNFLRISVGTSAECRTLLTALGGLVSAA
jgi:histidinol-phosphate aminotransferase